MSKILKDSDGQDGSAFGYFQKNIKKSRFLMLNFTKSKFQITIINAPRFIKHNKFRRDNMLVGGGVNHRK